jgi:hypothetical protein
MLPWPVPFQDDQITTPLPLAPESYLDGTVHRVPDIQLRDIYEMPFGSEMKIDYY